MIFYNISNMYMMSYYYSDRNMKFIFRKNVLVSELPDFNSDSEFGNFSEVEDRMIFIEKSNFSHCDISIKEKENFYL